MLTDKLEQVKKLKESLDALLPMSVENERAFWKKIRLDWNYNSNHIEGNTLTYGETQLLLMFDKTTGDHELREYQEMKAHDVAIHMVKEWAKDKSRFLTENDIRELNEIILVQPYWKEAETYDGQPTRRQIKVGAYKEHPNSVRLKNGETFEYASPLETPQKMAELIEMYRNSTIREAVMNAAQLHYSFIRIHPFDDGNGRVARLITNYELMKNDFPPIIVKSTEKEKYLTALQKADAGDLAAFHEYIADQLIWSLELAINAAKGNNIEEKGDLDKKLALLKMEIANVDVDNDMKVEFNKNIFLNIFDSWLSELLKGLIVNIKKFDEFFVKPGHYVSIKTSEHNGMGGDSIFVEFVGKDENEILYKLRDELSKKGMISSDTTVKVHAGFGTFKKGVLTKPFGCNYDLEVFFDYVKYQVYRNKFVATQTRRPVVEDYLFNALRADKNIKMVYFDAQGTPHLTADKKENGELYSKETDDENSVKIVASYSREEILNGKINPSGMERFAEPRLLHKPLTTSEIETLSAEMGETIYNHIDYFTKQIGLR
jgi:Fic family protein